ncbi:hypothetical protein [Limnohabitans sp.]|uniref:hypothetical protein n=1 Tax=Limnohabitans sp. TaxID=1907725 RepID=UPI00286EC773|nr:hypothetical protein [Limnohabitans sp.]
MSEDRLEALADMTAGVDAENPTAEQQSAQKQEQHAAQQSEAGEREWGLMLFSIGGMLTMVAPELKTVYSEDRCFMWGQHMHIVSEKHGWSAPGHSPEFALLVASVSFVVPTLAILPAKVRELRKQQNSIVGRVVAWWQRRKGAAPAQEKSTAADSKNGSE